MAKIAKNNNKLHIANGPTVPASFFGSIIDENNNEAYVTSPDRLLKPGTGSINTGDLSFMLHANDLGIGATILGLKGNTVLVYTESSNTPEFFTISGANNLVLACCVPGYEIGWGNVSEEGDRYLFIVDNVANETGCIVYQMPLSSITAYFNEPDPVTLNTVEFDFTGMQIGCYGDTLYPDPEAGEIAGGDYIADGLGTDESQHFLHDKKTASLINPFYITDMKCSHEFHTDGRRHPFIYFQFQNLQNSTIYNANECVIYSAMIGDDDNNKVSNLTFDIDNLFPAFLPSQWFAAGRSLVSKNWIDNGGNLSYFTSDYNTRDNPWGDPSKVNYGSGGSSVGWTHQSNFATGEDYSYNTQLSDSSLAFPYDDLTYLNCQRDGYWSNPNPEATSGHHAASYAHYKFDLYGRVINESILYRSANTYPADNYGDSHNNADPYQHDYGSEYKVWPMVSSEGYGSPYREPISSHSYRSYNTGVQGDGGGEVAGVGGHAPENMGSSAALYDLLTGMGALWFHGSVKINYLHSAIAINKYGGGGAQTHNNSRLPVIMISPVKALVDDPSNYWVKYQQLTTVTGFEDLLVNGMDFTGNMWVSNDGDAGAMLPDVTQDVRYHEAKMKMIKFTPDDVIGLPAGSNWWMRKTDDTDGDGYMAAFAHNEDRTFARAVRSERIDHWDEAVWACTLPADTSRSDLKTAGHPLFLINNSADAVSVHPMHTLKNWAASSPQEDDGGHSLLGDTFDDGIGDYDGYGVLDSTIDRFIDQSTNWAELPILTEYSGVRYLANSFDEEAESNEEGDIPSNPYDYGGYAQWIWNQNVTGLALDRTVSNISIADTLDCKPVMFKHQTQNDSASDINDTPNVPFLGTFSGTSSPSYDLLTNHFRIAYSPDGTQKIYNGTFSSITPVDSTLSSDVTGTKTFAAADGNIVFTPEVGSAESTTMFDLDIEAQDGDDNNFIAPFSVKYKYSFLYDGYQESPLALTSTDNAQPANNKEGYKIRLTFNVASLDYRITHVNIYSKYFKENGSGDSAYKLSRSIPFKPIELWGYDSATGLHNYEYFDRNAVAPSYETLTTIPESLIDSSMKYSICTSADSYLFVAGCSQPTIADDFSHYIFRSVQGSFSQFNWARDYQILPEVPVAMQSFNGRLYIFSPTKTFRLNQTSLEVEDAFFGAGCLDSRAVVGTEFGMCFADQDNIYLHDGSIPKVISQSIARGSKVSYTDGSGGWQDTQKSNVCITFDTKRKSFLIFFSYTGNIGTVNRCWAYNLLYKRWDLLSSPGRIIDTVIESDGTVLVTAEVEGSGANTTATYRFLAGSGFKKWTWISKDIILTNATQDKKLKKVRINSNSQLADADVALSYNSGTNISFTAIEELASGLYHKSIKPNSSTTFKSARIELSDIGSGIEVDSIGLIYRAKSIK